MEYLSSIVDSLSGSNIEIVLLIAGFAFLLMGTTRLKRIQIIPKWRKLLNIVGLSLTLSGLLLIVGLEVIAWLS